MIDLKFLRENPDVVKENIKKKFQDHKLPLVDEVIELDAKARAAQSEADELRASRNKLSKQIGALMGQGKKDEAEEVKAQVAANAARLSELEAQEKELSEKVTKIMMTIPNIIDPSVPIGKDDSCNVEIEKFGDPYVPDFEIPYHTDIMERFDGIDLDAAGKVAGNGFYYLMGDIARIHSSVIAYARDFMINRGFTYCVPPFMIRSNVVTGVMSFDEMDAMMYKIVGIIVLIGVMFTFNTLIFNLVIAAITLIAVHEIYSALGFEKKDWLMYAVLVPYTLLVMTSNYQVMRRLVMPMSFLLVTFYAIYLVVRNGTISYQKASGLLMFSGIVIFCFYSFIRLKELLPVEQYGYDAVFFILLILCFAWGGDTCAYFAGRAFGKHKLCPVVSPKKTVEGAIGGVLGTMVFGVIITLVYSVAANRMEAFTRSNIGVSMYVIIALLGCVAAVLGIYGDLFASVVKRQCGIKDYGTIFPGHGGILDRFDSVMFIAPFVTMVITAVFYY